MRKKILSFGLIFILVLGLSSSVYAADSEMTITYDGSDDLVYSIDASDFDTAFENMVPGETRTMNITLENTYDQTVDFYMNTEVLSAFEDIEGTADGAYTVKLYVTQDGEETVIYGSGDDSAYIGGDDSGLYDLNGSLNDSYLVATLAQGETAVVSLEIGLDGESQGNEYMSVDANLQFEFYVSYDEVAATVVTNTVYVTGDTISVQTGDDSSLMLYVLTISIAVLAAGSVVVIRRGKHEQSNR